MAWVLYLIFRLGHAYRLVKPSSTSEAKGIVKKNMNYDWYSELWLFHALNTGKALVVALANVLHYNLGKKKWQFLLLIVFYRAKNKYIFELCLMENDLAMAKNRKTSVAGISGGYITLSLALCRTHIPLIRLFGDFKLVVHPAVSRS